MEKIVIPNDGTTINYYSPSFKPRKYIYNNKISLNFTLSELSPESFTIDGRDIIDSMTLEHKCIYKDLVQTKELNEKAKLYAKYNALIYLGDEKYEKEIKEIEDILISKYNM